LCRERVLNLCVDWTENCKVKVKLKTILDDVNDNSK
jgi:hypothetical protein